MDASVFYMNLLKHHGGYQKKLTEDWADKKIYPDQQILTKIGGSQMDLYLGTLLPEQVFSELSQILQEEEIHTRKDFIHWISPKDYRILACSDKAKWILRLKNEDPETFIHLHPARYSPFSIRIKANTLKTTLLAATYYKIHNKIPENEVLNQLRKNNLSLSATREQSFHQKLLEFFIINS